MRALITVFIMLPASVFSQDLDFNLTGAGARAAGMGQAFIGVADDATAVVWNPAGLTTLERTEASFVGKQIFDAGDAKGDLPNIDAFDLDYAHWTPNFGSVGVPLKIADHKLVVALAYQKQLDFFFRSELFGDAEGSINTLTPAVAYQVSSLLSFGLASNIWFGSQELSSTFGSSNVDYSGFNLGVGSMVDFGGLSNPIPLKVGIAIKTPFNLDEDGDKVKMPIMYGFGASYRVGENLTLAADFEIRKYKSSDVADFDLNQFRIGGEYLIVRDFAVIPIRVGFQTVPTTLENQEWNDFDGLYEGDDSQVSGTSISVGSGLIFERFAFDVALVRQSYTWDFGGGGVISDVKMDFSKVQIITSAIVYF
jgi:hypothetical protein